MTHTLKHISMHRIHVFHDLKSESDGSSDTALDTLQSEQSKVVKTKLTRLDGVIGALQEKLKVSTKPCNIPLFSHIKAYDYGGSNYSNQGLLVIKSLKDYGLEEILTRHTRLTNDGKYIHHDNYQAGPIFSISQVYTQDEYYIFRSSAGSLFHVRCDEFRSLGYMAKSLRPGKPPLDTDSNIVAGFTIAISDISIGLTKNDKIVSTIVGDHIVVIDKDKGDVVVANENLIEYLNLTPQGTQTPKGNPIKHPYGVIKQMRIDRKGNFLLFISQYDDKDYKLHIVNRKNLEEIESHDNIIQILEIDNKNDLTAVDIDGKLVNIDTNFDQFPRGYVEGGVVAQRKVVEIKNILHEQLQSALTGGDLNMTDLPTSGQENFQVAHDIKGLIQKLWEVKIGEDTLRELFDAATTPAEIDKVSLAFEQIARNPTVAQVSGLTAPIERQIAEKRGEILLASLLTELEGVGDSLGMMDDFAALIAIERQLLGIRQKRSQIPGIHQVLDTSLRDLTTDIDTRIQSYQADHRAEMIASIDTGLETIGVYLDTIDYMTGLTSVYTTKEWADTEAVLAYLPTDQQDEYRASMHTLVKTRQGVLQQSVDSEKLTEKTKVAKKIQELEGLISQVEDIVESIEDEKGLENMNRTDPLVGRIRIECDLLQPSERDRLVLLLDGVFRERARDIRLSRLDQKGATYTLDEYGLDTGLYYSDRGHQSISYSIGGKRTPSGDIRLELRLLNGAEHIYDFDTYLSDPSAFGPVIRGIMAAQIRPEMSQADFVRLQSQIAGWKQSGKNKLQLLQGELRVSIQQGDTNRQKEIVAKISELKAQYSMARFVEILVTKVTQEKKINPRPYLQRVNDRFIVLDEERDIIKKLSDGMMIQKETGKGIDILEGPPGLGKTEIVRFVAGVTNREIIRIQCAKMDPSDMFFSPQLKAGETSRQPAEWIRLMQKPGVVILFDEIDKLSSECFDRLHSLFDGGRSVFDPQVGTFRAHRDAVFLGTRNSYEKMTNPITSRGTIVLMSAPGELNEAFKVSKFTGLPYFEKMNFSDFQQQYTKYTTTNTTDPHEKTIANIFGYIRSLVKTLNALRVKQKSENYDEKFEYELSYRDAEQIFLRYNRNPGASFKDKVIDVLVPKVRAVVLSEEEKTQQEQITKKVIEENF